MIHNIVITGGLGFIGSHVVLELLKNTNHNISIIYHSSPSQKINLILQSLRRDIPQTQKMDHYVSRIRLYKGSILDVQFLDNLFKENEERKESISCIMHLAAYKSVSESVNQPLKYYEVNFVGTLNLLKMVEKYKSCRSFVYSSTAAVYGQLQNAFETSPGNPINPYGQSKFCVQMLLKSLAKIHLDLKIIILRYANIVGNHSSGLIGDNPIGYAPSNLFAIIQEVILQKREKVMIFGCDYGTIDGTGVRDYVHVVDIAVAHIKVLQNLQSIQSNCQVINLGSGEGYSVMQIVAQFNRHLQTKLIVQAKPRRQGDIQKLLADCSKAKQILKWSPEKSLQEICQDSINFTLKLKKSVKQQKRK